MNKYCQIKSDLYPSRSRRTYNVKYIHIQASKIDIRERILEIISKIRQSTVEEHFFDDYLYIFSYYNSNVKDLLQARNNFISDVLKYLN